MRTFSHGFSTIFHSFINHNIDIKTQLVNIPIIDWFCISPWFWYCDQISPSFRRYFSNVFFFFSWFAISILHNHFQQIKRTQIRYFAPWEGDSNNLPSNRNTSKTVIVIIKLSNDIQVDRLRTWGLWELLYENRCTTSLTFFFNFLVTRVNIFS